MWDFFMKKTKLISCFVAGTMAVSVTACGSDTQTPSTSNVESAAPTTSGVDLTDVDAIMANLHEPTNRWIVAA